MKWVLSSKIQRATVVGANLDYIGSITIDEDLMDRAGLWPGERVMVVSATSGARLETYVITGERGSNDIFMNGPAALLIKKGEQVTISVAPIQPKNLLVDGQNRFVRFIEESERGNINDLALPPN